MSHGENLGEKKDVLCRRGMLLLVIEEFKFRDLYLWFCTRSTSTCLGINYKFSYGITNDQHGTKIPSWINRCKFTQTLSSTVERGDPLNLEHNANGQNEA